MNCQLEEDDRQWQKQNAYWELVQTEVGVSLVRFDLALSMVWLRPFLSVILDLPYISLSSIF